MAKPTQMAPRARQNGNQPPVDPAMKKFESEALKLFTKGAAGLAGSAVDPGLMRRLLDAASDRYRLECEFAQLQVQFNDFTAMKDKDAAQNLIRGGGRVRARIARIDQEWDGSQIGPDGNPLPSAREYMEKVIVPQTERRIYEQMIQQMAEEQGIEPPEEPLLAAPAPFDAQHAIPV